ncbi:TPA: hypothetical protein U0613_001373 [Streptococcus suis]|nr:hypothetical protein [Streptococcus suis]
MIKKIKIILDEFDNLLVEAESYEVDFGDGLESSIENLFDDCCSKLDFDDYTSVPGFDVFSNDEYTNEEISKLYNLVLYLDSENNKRILEKIFNELSTMQSDLD